MAVDADGLLWSRLLDRVSRSIHKRGLAATTRRIAARAIPIPINSLRQKRKDWTEQRKLKALAKRADATGCVVEIIHGSKMRLDVRPTGSRSLERTLALYGTREPASTEFYISVLKAVDEAWSAGPAPLVVDVGANVGYFALIAANILRDRVKVIAVEAEQENASRLEYNVNLNGYANVVVLPVAAGARPGVGAIAIRESANVHRMAEVSADRSMLQDVDIVTIDALIGRYAEGESSPVIVRMDVEGYEGFAFQGMRALLEGDRPCHIFVELHKSAYKWFPQIADALRSGGFEINRLDTSQGHRTGMILRPVLDDVTKLRSTAHLFCARTSSGAR